MENTNEILDELRAGLNTFYSMGRVDAFKLLLATIKHSAEDQKGQVELEEGFVPVISVDQLVDFLENVIQQEESNVRETPNIQITIAD